MTRVLILGWDGATWDYIDPLLEQGRLPHLAKLLDSGVRATLHSTVPPYTNVAWPSLVTGKVPSSTGVFDATRAVAGGDKAVPTNLTGYRGTPIWKWVNRYGLRSAVLNVPTTFPAKPLDGYLVTGFDSVLQSTRIAYPPNLLDEWATSGRPYTILREEIELVNSQNPHQARGDLERFVERWAQLTLQQGQMVAWLWRNRPTDLLFAVFSATDSINHRTLDQEQIARVYEAADGALGEIINAIDDDTLVCLVSDHGSTPAYRYISLYRILSDAGWLRFNPWLASRFWNKLPQPLGRYANAVWRQFPEWMRRALSRPIAALEPRSVVAYDNIDWDQTRVYARTGMGALYINREQHKVDGIVSDGEYEHLRDDVIHQLQSLRDNDDQPLFSSVKRREEVYSGANLEDDPPDLIFTPARWSDHVITGFPSDELVRPIPANRPYGTHTPEGILTLTGPGIQNGKTLSDTEIIDVVPTILTALDIPLPQEIDGTVIEDAFVSHPHVRWAADVETTEVIPGREDIEAKDADQIMKRLRALGYLE